jgi:spermidine synthase
MKNEGLTGMYYDYALAAPVMAGVYDDDENADILILGMGTGTYATQLKKYMPHANITGVEIDDKITDLSHKYFALPESIPTVTYDGRAYLNSDDRKYDVIMVDAYQDITIPFQMSSVEFFTLVKKQLNPEGVMVVNMNMKSDGEDGINEYLSDTISSVFPNVYTVDVSNNTNRELFASESDKMIDNFKTGYQKETDEDLYQMMERVDIGLVKYEAGDRILTDDKAPVELLSMNAIDALIRDEVDYYKDIYNEKGLKGLLEEL